MTPLTPRQHILAARVPLSIPSGTWGLWETFRQNIPDESPERSRAGFSSFTVLAKFTEATMHKDHGDIVMEDSLSELEKHLPIWMSAHGRVLVSGLGLGCVVRGLLANTNVKHIDVMEIDSTIISLIGYTPEFVDNRRIAFHHCDALKKKWPNGTSWDFAWHDCHHPNGNGVDLHIMHLELMRRYKHRCKRQGAWALPREVKRLIPGCIG